MGDDQHRLWTLQAGAFQQGELQRVRHEQRQSVLRKPDQVLEHRERGLLPERHVGRRLGVRFIKRREPRSVHNQPLRALELHREGMRDEQPDRGCRRELLLVQLQRGLIMVL